MKGEQTHAEVVQAARDSLTKFTKAATTTQLQRAAERLQACLSALLAVTASSAQKPAAEVFIAASSAASSSLEGAGSDPARLQTAVSIAEQSLRGLNAVRSILRGRPFEVEVQHYTLVRKLAALKAFKEAAQQGWQLLAALCRLWPVQQSPRPASDDSCSSTPGLPEPPATDGGALAQQAAPIVVGAVLNLLISTMELGGSCTQLVEMTRVSTGIHAWLRFLPEPGAQRHAESLFRCWYKAAGLLVEDRECKETDKLSVFKCLLSIWSIYPSAPRLHQIASKLGQLPISSHISLVEHSRSLSGPSNTTNLVMAESLAGRCDDSSSSQQVASFLADLANSHPGCEVCGVYVAGLLYKTGCSHEAGVWVPALKGAVREIQRLFGELQALECLSAAEAELVTSVLRALNFLRKAASRGAAWPAELAAADAQGAQLLASAMRASAQLLQVPAVRGHGTLEAKYAYPAASALVLAAEIDVQCCLRRADRSAECTETAGLLSGFWHQQRAGNTALLKPAELRWIVSVLHSLTNLLTEAGLRQPALAIAQSALRGSIACAMVCKPEEDREILQSLAAICSTAASHSEADSAVRQQACMDALDQLCSSGSARPQTVRPLLHLLLTPEGPEASLSPGVSALRKMMAAPESHATVVSEAIKVLHAAGGKNAAAPITDLLDTLLEEIRPAESHPVAHVRALHLKAAVAARPEECMGLLQSAADRMARLEETCGSGEAAWALADSHALLALHHAQQALVLPGEADSAAAANTAQTAVDWEAVRHHAGLATAAWERALSAASSTDQHAAASPAQAAVSVHLAAELAALAGLHGDSGGQQAACSAASGLATAAGCAPPLLTSSQWPLEQALGLHGMLEESDAPGKASARAAGLCAQAHGLAAQGSNCCTVVLHRVQLHLAAATACRRSGDIAGAMYDASEALRLAASLVASTSQATAPAQRSLTCHPGSPGWQVRGSYLVCLLHTGELWEMLGSSSDALHALQEGHQLAQALGSLPFTQLFAARLAEITAKRGEAAHSGLPAACTVSAAAGGLAPISQRILAAETQVAAADSMQMSGQKLAALDHLAAAAEQLLPLLPAGGSPGTAAMKSSRKTTRSGNTRTPSPDGLACEAGALWKAVELLSRVRLTEAECHFMLGDLPTAESVSQAAAQALEVYCSSTAGPAAGALAPLESHPVQHAAVELQRMRLALCQLSSSSDSLLLQPAMLWGDVTPAGGTADAQPDTCSAKSRGRKGPPAKRAAAEYNQGQEQQRLLEEYLWRLLPCHRAVQQVPLLFREISQVLAHICSMLQLPSAALLFLHASLGSSLCAQFRAGIELRKCALERKSMAQPHKDASKPRADQTAMGFDLLDSSICGSTLEDLELHAAARLDQLLAAIPSPGPVCSISAAGREWWKPGHQLDAILLSRCCRGQPPLVLSIPCHQDGVEQLGQTLAGILEDSAASMKLDCPKDGAAQRKAWWKLRMGLDLRLAALLARLDALLSPWRCMLLGSPADATMQSALDTACGAAAAKLACCRAKSGNAASLLGVLLQASDQMSDDEMQAAVAALLSASGRDSDPPEAARIASSLRASVAAACGNCSSQPAGQGGSADSCSSGLADITNAIAGTTAGVAPRRQKGGSASAVGRRATRKHSCRGHQSEAFVAKPACGQVKAATIANSVGVQPARERQRVQRGPRPGCRQTMQDCIPETEQLRSTSDGPSTPLETVRRSHRTAARPKHAAAETPASVADDKTALGAENNRLFQTPAQVRGSRTAAKTGRRTGIMAGMQSGQYKAAASSRLPKETGAAAQAGSRPVAAQASQELDPAVGHPSEERVSETESDDEASREDAGGFMLHRGGPTELGELASRMRGLALEEAEARSQSRAGPASLPTKLAAGRQPVVLVLDSALQALPWESLPSLKAQRIFRVPSLRCAAYAASKRSLVKAAAGSAAMSRMDWPAVNMSSTLFMLNPSGDLPTTQAAFETLFTSQPTWQGTVGHALPQQELAAGLQARDMFVYCGHGSGTQYIPQRALQCLPSCAAAFLMGCSSGRLAARGRYECHGPILAYLQAGCPAAVGNLWDVTDRDIDRFSKSVLEQWLASSADGQRKGVCMAAAVAGSRQVCRLPHLIGAAPVCYGLPTVVQAGSGRV